MADQERFEVNGEEYFIKNPDSKVLSKSQSVYTKAFRKACDDGAILKQSLEKHMRDQGLWDDATQEKYEVLLKESADIEFRVKNKEYKQKSVLLEKALRLKEIREDISELLSVRNSMDSLTAEGQADQERFNYLVSACSYSYKTQSPIFISMDDYIEKSGDDLGLECAKKFASFMYGVDENYEDTLVENRLLKKLQAVDEKGFLLNAKGERVDSDGNLLDEFGARIDQDGNRIDINNNPIIDDSVIDELEFEDDMAVVEDKTEDKKPVKKPRTRKKVTQSTE